MDRKGCLRWVVILGELIDKLGSAAGLIGYGLFTAPWGDGATAFGRASNAIIAALNRPIAVWQAVAIAAGAACLQYAWGRGATAIAARGAAHHPESPGPAAGDVFRVVLEEYGRASRELGASAADRERHAVARASLLLHLRMLGIIAEKCGEMARADLARRWPPSHELLYSIALRLGGSFRLGIDDVFDCMDESPLPRSTKGREILSDVGQLGRDMRWMLMGQCLYSVPVLAYLRAGEGKWHLPPEEVFSFASADMDESGEAVAEMLAKMYQEYVKGPTPE